MVVVEAEGWGKGDVGERVQGSNYWMINLGELMCSLITVINNTILY